MKIQVKRFDQTRLKTDLLIIFISNHDFSLLNTIKLGFINELNSILKKHILSDEENTIYVTLGNSSVSSVFIISVKDDTETDMEKFREAGYVIRRFLTKIKGSKAHLLFSNQSMESIDSVRSVVEGILLSTYEKAEYKKKSTPKQKGINQLDLLLQNHKEIPAIQKQVKISEKVINAVNLARSLTNQPANLLTPLILADRVKKKFKSHSSIKTRILQKKQLELLGMNAFLAVAKGSVQPPALIINEYRCDLKKAKKLALVGKGITFDSGGISIKPSHHMEKMKYDMAGAAAVISVMSAVSDLKPQIDIIAVAPAAENLPGGNAFLPGDIVRAFNGKTVEIIDTDAEGRLLLADTLAFIEKKFQPNWIIDIATLTGSVANTFGEHCSAMFGNDVNLKHVLTRASQTSGEKIWDMPMWEEYRKTLNSPIADLKHVGGKVAGGITAALFLGEFINSTPWVHIDIAGTAYDVKSKKYLGTGASGYGVRLLLEVIHLLEISP